MNVLKCAKCGEGFDNGYNPREGVLVCGSCWVRGEAKKYAVKKRRNEDVEE